MAPPGWDLIDRTTIHEAREDFDSLRPGLDFITLREWWNEDRGMSLQLNLFRTAEGEERLSVHLDVERFMTFDTVFVDDVESINQGVVRAKQVMRDPDSFAR